MIKRLVLALAISVSLLSGCTLHMDNPLAKKVPEDQKILRARIASYELLERESELIHNITRLKAETEQMKAPKPKAPEPE